MKMNYKYLITYATNSPGLIKRISVFAPESLSFADITGGFWVNREGQITFGDDCLYFVMPHHIIHIKNEHAIEGG